MYKTTDIGVVSALICVGYKLDSIDKTNSRQSEFLFDEDEDDVNQMVNDYWNKEVTIDALTYYEAIKMIKSRLYSN